MTALSVLTIFNYCLVLVYGLLLSVLISGGWENQRQQRITALLCPVFLAVQGLCALLWGVEATQRLYPSVIHIPMVLILVLALKRRPEVSLVSVCTAYLCCQFPRWIKLVVIGASGSELAGEICYTLCIIPIFYLLFRYFVPAAHSAITFSRRTLVLFCSLPIAYYLFDYATSIYSDALYIGIQALNEFLPSALLVFYVVFFIAYHGQINKLMETEMENTLLETHRKLSDAKLEEIRRMETQAAIYQHDMRHHLVAIEGLLATGNLLQAEEYIQSVRTKVDALVPKRFCENETVNLLCSAFAEEAKELGVDLQIKAALPKALSIPDAELCSVLSNGLENALQAASHADQAERWVSLTCSVQRNKLLLEIRNPYIGKVTLLDGLPVSDHPGHGYGCRSIRAIAEQHQGLYSFEPRQGIFTLRIVLPVTERKFTP